MFRRLLPPFLLLGCASLVPQVVLAAGTADLAVKQTANASVVTGGQTVIYTMVAANRGPSASQLDIEWTLPGGVYSGTPFASFSVDCGPGGPSPDGNFCEYSNVDTGTVRTMTVTAVVASGATGRIKTTASVNSESTTLDPVPGNDSSTQTLNIK